MVEGSQPVIRRHHAAHHHVLDGLFPWLFFGHLHPARGCGFPPHGTVCIGALPCGFASYGAAETSELPERSHDRVPAAGYQRPEQQILIQRRPERGLHGLLGHYSFCFDLIMAGKDFQHTQAHDRLEDTLKGEEIEDVPLILRPVHPPFQIAQQAPQFPLFLLVGMQFMEFHVFEMSQATDIHPVFSSQYPHGAEGVFGYLHFPGPFVRLSKSHGIGNAVNENHGASQFSAP